MTLTYVITWWHTVNGCTHIYRDLFSCAGFACHTLTMLVTVHYSLSIIQWFSVWNNLFCFDDRPALHCILHSALISAFGKGYIHLIDPHLWQGRVGAIVSCPVGSDQYSAARWQSCLCYCSVYTTPMWSDQWTSVATVITQNGYCLLWVAVLSFAFLGSKIQWGTARFGIQTQDPLYVMVN